MGSGYFGTVSCGVWEDDVGNRLNVAAKILKKETSPQEKVKFLQEAAILGQFQHQNIIKLYGVVTVGNPVSGRYFTHVIFV